MSNDLRGLAKLIVEVATNHGEIINKKVVQVEETIMPKKIVHYAGPVQLFRVNWDNYNEPDLEPYTDENKQLTLARIYEVLDHPRLGYQPHVRTSVVVNVDGDTIETLNTLYVKAE
jgi:hypothetical protein